MKDRKKLENQMGLTAQSTDEDKAKIDRRRCFDKRASPDLSKMVSERLDRKTLVFAKSKKLLKNTIELIKNRKP